MSVNVTMPALSPTMEDGVLSRWLVQEGDSVSAGDVIAEIETDKATMEVEAVDEGIIRKIVVPAGTSGVKVNSVIAILGDADEDVSDVDVSPPASPSVVESESKPEPESEPQPESKSESKPESKSKPESVSPPPPKKAENSGDRIFVSPLARRLAEQRGIDLRSVTGSGPRGRIVKADIEGGTLSTSTAVVSVSGSGSDSPSLSDAEILNLFDSDSYTLKSHDGMRRVIAERLVSSIRSVPSYNVSVECRLDALLELRATINDSAPLDEDDKPAYRISVNDFVLKALACALRDVPQANVSWTSEARIYHKVFDIGVAVAVDDGLFTPIVRGVESLSLTQISSEVRRLAGLAHSKKLAPGDYQGGCTTVSNLGMYGVDRFTSIINPPHASIVSIGAGRKRAIVDDSDSIIAATLMDATFAFDHRAIDGALGGELASAFRRYIESPTLMLV